MKKLLSFIISTFIFLPLFALPGFTPYLSDNSGDYVFYRDDSFERESYLGFLTYDNETYQVRYYAPIDKKNFLPEKNISILFTVNPDKNFLELTGEKIISAITPNSEDVDIINYMHDIFYELNSRRCKADPVSPENEDYKTSKSFWENGLSLNQDFAQFGGRVSLIYDVMVPLFNLKRIIDAEGNDIFSIVTFGTLASSLDSSFDDFKGITSKLIKKEKGAAINRKANSTEYTFSNNKIRLDENWSQTMENLWLLGDSALISANEIPSYESMGDRYDYFVLRRLIMSSQDSYVEVPGILIKTEKDGYTITSNIYQHKTDNVVKNFKVLRKNGNGSFNLMLLTAFQKDYIANKKYFDEIVLKNSR
ncbi:MAG: hypothetical protein MJ182_06000 [Treponema sp.]|nr:hypothetical protein [Treponema sp.]